MIAGFVRGQTLRLSVPRIAADTIDYLTAKFLFQSSGWDGLEKWAHFARGEAAYDIRLTDDEITADAHLNLSAGKWKVYLHGNRYADGAVVQRVTTEVQELEVLSTGVLDGEPFPTVPPSAGEQIIASAQLAEAEAKKSARRAAESETSAAQSAENAALSEKAAAESRDAADLSETNAAEHAKSAAQSAAEADLSAERAEQVAVANGYAAFEIQPDGCLYLSRTANIVDRVDFRLTDAGDLEVIVNG